MRTIFKALLAITIILVGNTVVQAQCPGCARQDSLCPPPTTSTDVTLCGNTAFTDTAGNYLDENLTFLFNSGYVIRENDDLFAAFNIPPLPPPFPSTFPSPFDITVYVERGTLNSITGLPPGISWETDSSANGNNYTPFFINKGCVRFCGELECGQLGTFTANLNFTTVYKQNMGGSFPIPLPIPDSTVENYTLQVTFTIEPSTNLILDVATASTTTVIDSGQSITLDGTLGFAGYAWSNGDTTASITVSPTDTTNYVLTVVDSFGCEQKDSIEVQVLSVVDSIPEDTTGITTIGYNSALVQLYPNPAKGSFTVNIAQPLVGDGFMEVLDITGKRVLHQPVLSPNNVITLDAPKGLYIVKVVNGSDTYTHKLLLY